MNAFINYLIEANLGLAFFILVYFIFLKNETDFKVKRQFMLMALLSSAILPLFHFNMMGNVLPVLGDFVPPTWLPEIVVVAPGSGGSQDVGGTIFNAWFFVQSIYVVGVVVGVSLFLFRLWKLAVTVKRSAAYASGSFVIIESTANRSSFSFFRFIFIGQAGVLTQNEKQQIIEHEQVHVQQLHSVDIMLVHVMQIFFWFNPLLLIYQKILVQLHEFEADARAVENRDVNNYCSLLAKVALLSADYPLANHFSNSLILKRIDMMRTLKSKIRSWKVVAILMVLPAFFFVISCQDQVLNEASEIAQNSSTAVDLPDDVQRELDQMKSKNPDKKFVVLEVEKDEAGRAASVKEKLAGYNPDDITSVNILKDKVDRHGNKRSFVIIEFNDMTKQLAESSKDGDIFTVVEESAMPVGGMPALASVLQNNLSYPAEVRAAGKEGTVMIQFVVNQDGTLSDFTVLRGVDPLLDAEALRVAKLLPPWTPGKQSGKAVRQRFVLPINFKLENGAQTESPQEVRSSLDVKFTVTDKDGKRIVNGVVRDKNGDAIKGANIVNVGTTSGTVTDANGNFTITVSQASKQLAVSFVGFDTKMLDF